MKKEIIAAIISGIIGLIGGYSIHNEQNLTVQINGQDVDISEIQETITALENENQALKIQINNLQNHTEDNPSQKASAVNNSDYLVYRLEPYSKSGYKKVTDESISIAGVSYNNGFELYTVYSDSHCIFNLEGKYTSLTGKIGCDDSNYTDKIPVEFWGDEVLIDTIVLHKNDLAQDFTINLSGVSKFEIKIPYANNSDVAFADVKIY